MNKTVLILVDKIQQLKPAKEGFTYSIDHNSVYGGYRLVLKKIEGGAEYGCFGGNGCEARMSLKHFLQKLYTIIGTLQEK